MSEFIEFNIKESMRETAAEQGGLCAKCRKEPVAGPDGNALPGVVLDVSDWSDKFYCPACWASRAEWMPGECPCCGEPTPAGADHCVECTVKGANQ